jgi:hypothetical protein
MREGIRGQRGQTSIEYLGMLAGVVALLVVMIALAPGVGERITCEIGNQIAKVTGEGGGTCGPVEGLQPATPCVVADSDGKLKASVTAFSVKGGGEIRVLRQERSDGKTVVTLSGGGELGAQFGIGGGAHVDAGDRSAGGGARGEANVGLRGEGGGQWIFDSDAEADEFLEIVRNRARDGAIRGAAPGIGHIVTGLFGEDRDIPDPDIVYVQGGVGAGASGEFGGLLAGGKIGAEGMAVLGTRINRDTGERTVYLEMQNKGEASAYAILGASGGADVTGQLAITYDRDGNPINIAVSGRGAVQGSLPALRAGEQNPARFLEQIKLGVDENEGRRLEFEASMDLRDPANRAAFDDFMANPITGAAGLGRQFADGGQFTATAYDFDADKYGGSADVALGIKFGIEGSYEGSNGRLIGAWYWNPESGGVQPWTRCSG